MYSLKKQFRKSGCRYDYDEVWKEKHANRKVDESSLASIHEYDPIAVDRDESAGNLVSAETMVGHFLIGQRQWGVTVSGNQVTVFTSAWERILFPASVSSGAFAADQMRIWDEYLVNAMDGLGHPVLGSSMHHERF